MRFSTATALTALAAIGSVSASVLPRVLDNYDLAQPVAFEQREVPALQCDDKPIYIGQLKLHDTESTEWPAAFEGLRNHDGYQQLDVQKAGRPARFENFAFTPCNSSFMGYEPQVNKAATMTFGRLQPAHLVGKRCVSADKLGENDARLIAAKCEPSDDSGQLLQFWSLTKQPAADSNTFDYYVNFLGQPADDPADFPGSYTLNLAKIGANKIVRLLHSQEEGALSDYFLKLA